MFYIIDQNKLKYFLYISLFSISGYAREIIVTPKDYLAFLTQLNPGDTLVLSKGNYLSNLTLKDIQGTIAEPIVIIGEGLGTIFEAQSCCNTVSLTRCAHLILSNFQLNGNNKFVDAVKAEGTSGNWAHHITIEKLHIINYGYDQQAVGISTKCPAWNWIIRSNKIIGAGTGMYLGNSPGNMPFVNGIIENNLIQNTVGYNIEIKHQLDGARDAFPETQVHGKTIIRYNVFTKDKSSSTGGNARPNLLVGGFPSSGWGSLDYYEIYGNFFYNNPVEALFQGTGNINLYANIFINHFDPSGFRTVYITPQNGVNPQDIKVFHNTIWSATSTGGLKLFNPNPNYKQYCYANAVLSTQAISNFTSLMDNVTDNYDNANKYFLSASTNLSDLDLYPRAGQLTGNITANDFFIDQMDWQKDFNQENYDWNFRGAYSGCCINKGWKLSLDTIPTQKRNPTISFHPDQIKFLLYPNPFNNNISIDSESEGFAFVYDQNGKIISSFKISKGLHTINLEHLSPGIYTLSLQSDKGTIHRKIIK